MKGVAIVGPLVFIAAWAAIVQLQLVDSFFLPSPMVTVRKLFELFASRVVIGDLLSTMRRVFLAFMIASAVGIPTGLVLGKTSKIYRSLEFIIDFFRSTPATALFPLFLLFFGITDTSKIAAATFASTLIIIFNTAYGVIHANPARALAAKMMGASNMQIFRWILFWESLPQTCIGLRSAVSLSLVVIIVTEMFIGTTSGLGRKIIDAQTTYEIPTMYALILLTGIVGYVLNAVLLAVEKKLLHWSGK